MGNHRAPSAAPWALALALLAGCTADAPSSNMRPADASRTDARATDAARADASRADARASDARPTDAEPGDARPSDADLGDAQAPEAGVPNRLRIATFNAALERPTAGKLVADLKAGSAQARAVAAIIRKVQPDILVLQEFDYDDEGEALRAFNLEYLSSTSEPLLFTHTFAVPSNTGVPSGVDLDGDGQIQGPNDALGFGQHPGHYAFAVLSRFPLDSEGIRTFRRLRWRDLPEARLPSHPDGRPFYSEAALAVLPLSSKSHADIPIRVPGGPALHLLVSHPTPPVFDGPEDRNGRRNFDEIGFWKRYLDGVAFGDDGGRTAALDAAALAVILGDLNADPVDGDGVPGAVAQVLDHPRIHPAVARGDQVPRSAGGAARPVQPPKTGDPAFHTAGWGLRADYVLPTAGFTVLASGVFWPAPGEPDAALVTDPERPQANPSSDHRLVWVDVAWPPAP